MIALKRGPEPESLRVNAARWTAEYVNYVGPRSSMPNSQRYRYRARDVKEQLTAASAGKCMYCESPVTATHPGEIEHIQPSSKRPDLVVAWTNLGFVCHECNRSKSDYLDPELPLIDPYAEAPDNHLLMIGNLIRHRPGSLRGRMTVKRLDLNRGELAEARLDRMKAIEALLDQAALLSGTAKHLIEAEVQKELEDSRPYAACARIYAELAG